ncbi:hypothetical protein MTR67_026750, partial [Solanum verrucosum]
TTDSSAQSSIVVINMNLGPVNHKSRLRIVVSPTVRRSDRGLEPLQTWHGGQSTDQTMIRGVTMDYFLVVGDLFEACVEHHDQEGIVFGHRISGEGMQVDQEKVKVIAKLPLPILVKGVQSLLGHAGFYMRFINDLSKVAHPLSMKVKEQGQGYYQAKRSEKAEEVEGKQGWYSPKPLSESPNRSSARLKFQQVSP